MTDRAQPGAIGSVGRNWEIGEVVGWQTDGWIVPAAEPTQSAQKDDSIDETAFTAFDQQSSSTSLEVTIGAGEAFVEGWIARDLESDVLLDEDTADQIVYVGWDEQAVYNPDIHDARDDADRLRLGLESEFGEANPKVPLWSFDTDVDGVTGFEDLRRFGPTIDVQHAYAERELGIPVYATVDDVPDDRSEGSLYWIESEESLYIEDGQA